MAAEAAWQRHFLALLPDEAARADLAALPLPALARPVHPDDLHLTLAFLGTLDAERAPLALAAAREAADLASGEVHLDRLEHWLTPPILCAGAADPGTSLARLTQSLRAALAARGLPVDSRPFRAHVTLARRVPPPAEGSSPIDPPIRWPMREIALLASRGPSGSGPRYAVLERIPLPGAGRVFSQDPH